MWFLNSWFSLVFEYYIINILKCWYNYPLWLCPGTYSSKVDWVQHCYTCGLWMRIFYPSIHFIYIQNTIFWVNKHFRIHVDIFIHFTSGVIGVPWSEMLILIADFHRDLSCRPSFINRRFNEILRETFVPLSYFTCTLT